MFKIIDPAEARTDPMESGHGETVLLVDQSLGTEKIDLHLNRRAPGGPLSPATNETFMFYRQIDHFIQCIQTGSRPAVSASDGRATLAVVEAVYESQRTQQKVLLRQKERSCHGNTLSDSVT